MQHSKEIVGSVLLPSVFDCSTTTLFQLKMLNSIESDGRAISIGKYVIIHKNTVNISEKISSSTVIPSYIGVKLDTSLSRIEGT
jgi:hypothetical protein